MFHRERSPSKVFLDLKSQKEESQRKKEKELLEQLEDEENQKLEEIHLLDNLIPQEDNNMLKQRIKIAKYHNLMSKKTEPINKE